MVRLGLGLGLVIHSDCGLGRITWLNHWIVDCITWSSWNSDTPSQCNLRIHKSIATLRVQWRFYTHIILNSWIHVFVSQTVKMSMFCKDESASKLFCNEKWWKRRKSARNSLAKAMASKHCQLTLIRKIDKAGSITRTTHAAVAWTDL